jgi:hypothetical protein
VSQWVRSPYMRPGGSRHGHQAARLS